MNITGCRWFAGSSCIGVVMVDDVYDGRKYYIGTGKGLDEENDKLFIAEFGTSFPKNVGDVLFNIGED